MANIKYTDIDLNLQRNPVSRDLLKISDEEAIKNSVKNLLMSEHYDKPFYPEFGSGIRDQLFENWLPTSAATIEKNIAFILKNFEPRVTLLGIEISRDSTGTSISIGVYFRINSTSKTSIVNLILARTR